MKACPAPERLCGSQRGMLTPVMETGPLGGVQPLEWLMQGSPSLSASPGGSAIRGGSRRDWPVPSGEGQPGMEKQSSSHRVTLGTGRHNHQHGAHPSGQRWVGETRQHHRSSCGVSIHLLVLEGHLLCRSVSAVLVWPWGANAFWGGVGSPCRSCGGFWWLEQVRALQ